ncbi:hypothetical protein H0H87_012096 [Tephrocybe sp. NHM501043]|nr:hypothetical protein H0H87_012096 [Tephrocybe sp. NHM501043]
MSLEDIPPLAATVTAALLLLTVGRFYYRHLQIRAHRKLPPGPPGILFLGNVLQVPGKHHHVDPSDDYWASSRLGKTHSIARKLTAGVMSDVRAGKTEALQEFEAVLNIQNLLEDGGKEWFHHMERVAASTVLSAGFGMHCPTGHEPELKQLLNVINEIVKLLTPSASIINVLPFLDLIPGPMPWRTRAQSFRGREKAIFKRIIDEAVTGKGSGMNTYAFVKLISPDLELNDQFVSWASAFAREDKPDGDQRRLVKMFSAVSYEAHLLINVYTVGKPDVCLQAAIETVSPIPLPRSFSTIVSTLHVLDHKFSSYFRPCVHTISQLG